MRMWRVSHRFSHNAFVARFDSLCRHSRGHAAVSRSWTCSETPNPDVRKFEFMASGSITNHLDLPNARSRLLTLDGVSDVFVSASRSASSLPWVSVTRIGDTNWETLAPQVQAILDTAPDAEKEASSSHQGTDDLETSDWTGTAASISEVIDHRIRPTVQADGGDVELLRWDESSGEVVLTLRGACRGCPQSAVTLQETILKTLQHFVPEVKSVISEEPEADANADSDPFADISHEHDGDQDASSIVSLSQGGTPFFSTFAGTSITGPKLRRVRFISRIDLAGRTPEHIFVRCKDCKARRTIEDPQDLLKKEKGNLSGKAAVVICPTCCVLITP